MAAQVTSPLRQQYGSTASSTHHQPLTPTQLQPQLQLQLQPQVLLCAVCAPCFYIGWHCLFSEPAAAHAADTVPTAPLSLFIIIVIYFYSNHGGDPRRTVLQVRGPVSAGQGLGTAARDVPARLRAGIVIIRIVIIP